MSGICGVLVRGRCYLAAIERSDELVFLTRYGSIAELTAVINGCGFGCCRLRAQDVAKFVREFRCLVGDGACDAEHDPDGYCDDVIPHTLGEEGGRMSCGALLFASSAREGGAPELFLPLLAGDEFVE